MKKALSILFLAITLFTMSSLSAQITYEGDGAKGKHLVFVASDHEYRAEECLPALARIMAKHHDYKCTVLFGLNEQGEIQPGASNIPGLEVLEKADLLVLFTRFLDLPDEQMKHIDAYLQRGGPVVGLRTSSHAFKIGDASKTYAHYSFQSKDPAFLKGYGQQILGNSWEGHYGRNHKQGTRIQHIPEQSENPILRGVKDGAFCYAGAYMGVADESFTVLANSQPMVSMEKDAGLDPKKGPVPCTWTRHYTSKSGVKGRVFHSTQGASEDILDPDYRRMIINGIFWAVGDEALIKADNKIDFVGLYEPNTFNGAASAKGVKPADLASFDSPIVPKRTTPNAKKGQKKATKKK